MKRIKTTCAIAATALMLAGCGGMELQRAEGLKASGSKFSKNLYTGYLELSKSEWQEGDDRDSDAFAMRAVSAAGGTPGQPEISPTANCPRTSWVSCPTPAPA